MINFEITNLQELNKFCIDNNAKFDDPRFKSLSVDNQIQSMVQNSYGFPEKMILIVPCINEELKIQILSFVLELKSK